MTGGHFLAACHISPVNYIIDLISAYLLLNFKTNNIVTVLKKQKGYRFANTFRHIAA